MNMENYAALPAFAGILVRAEGSRWRREWQRRAAGFVVVTTTSGDTLVANGLTLSAEKGRPCVLAAIWCPRFALDEAQGDLSVQVGDVIALQFRPDLVVPFEVMAAGVPPTPAVVGALLHDGFAGQMRPDLKGIAAFDFPTDPEPRH